MTLEEIKGFLKENLTESRYNHSLSVAQTAEDMARRFGADEKKAYLAGLVHDCAKSLNEQELKERVKLYNIQLDEETLNAPWLLHSFVGAYDAREILGIEDSEIFDAIYYHTIGKENMPLLTAIIYIADATEPLRSYHGVEETRKALQKSLFEGIGTYALQSISHLKKRGGYIHPNTFKVGEYYLQK